MKKSLFFLLPIIFTVLMAACSDNGTGNDNADRDTTPPEIVATHPMEGEEVPVSDSIVVTFSEPIDCSFVDTSCINIGPDRTGTITCDSNTFIFDPDLFFDFAVLVRVTVKAGIKDTSGNAMPADYVFEFCTAVEWGK